MKPGHTKRAYLLLPQLIKEAAHNKENMPPLSQTLNLKIPVSAYLESSLRLNQLQLPTPGNPTLSQHSDYLFDEDQFIKQQLESLKLKDQHRNTAQPTTLKTQNPPDTTQFKEDASRVHFTNKTSNQTKKSSIKANSKKKFHACQSLLRSIKQKKKVGGLGESKRLTESRIVERDMTGEMGSRSQQEIEPVMSFLQQVRSSDKVVLDSSKFQQFLETTGADQQFHKALRTFVYSYYIQNVLDH